ncbi:MAG: alpha/beta hydrolase [Cyanobacteria bacterium P01_H01_bin.121]
MSGSDLHPSKPIYKLTPPRDSACVLVFIHGWLLSDAYWQPLIEQLALHYQCLSYDLRGFGPEPARQSNPKARRGKAVPSNSQAPSGETTIRATLRQANATAIQVPSYTPEAYAHELAALLESLSLESVWLVGHSLGGTIALWCAAHYPDLVKGVTCVNAGGGIYLREEFERFRNAGRQLVKLRPRWLCNLPLLDLAFTRASVVQPLERHWGRQRLLDFVLADYDAALGALLDSTTEEQVHRLPQLVANLAQPVYFIAGDKDPIMEPKYVRHLASFHPLFNERGENLIELADCGHLAMLEQTDLLASKLQSILAQHLNTQVQG